MKIQIEEADLRSVLEALEEIHPGNMTPMAEGNWNKAITICKQALEQPAQQQEPEPVAIIGNWGRVEWYDGVYPQIGDVMYSAPASKPWVGLTDADIEEAINANCGTGLWVMANDIEAKLKEKNNG